MVTLPLRRSKRTETPRDGSAYSSLTMTVVPLIRTPITEVEVVPFVVSMKMPKSLGTLLLQVVSRGCSHGRRKVYIVPSPSFWNACILPSGVTTQVESVGAGK